jgi:formylglycine-generating enzyme required for sulfatase activity
MLLQRAGTGTLPPPGFTPPPWASLASNWDASPQPVSSTVILGPATVSIGHDDFESDDGIPEKASHVRDHEFGWDNESPKREVHVEEFQIEWRPVTNGQFYEFYKQQQDKGQLQFPASWVELECEIKVTFWICASFPSLTRRFFRSVPFTVLCP